MNRTTAVAGVGAVLALVAATLGVFGLWKAFALLSSMSLVVVFALLFSSHRFAMKMRSSQLRAMQNVGAVDKRIKKLSEKVDELPTFDEANALVENLEVPSHSKADGQTPTQASITTVKASSAGDKKASKTVKGLKNSKALSLLEFDPWMKLASDYSQHLDSAETFALVTRSTKFRDVLAYIASDGRFSYGQLSKFIENAPSDEKRLKEFSSFLNPEGLVALGRVVGSQNFTNQDAEQAVSILRFVAKAYGAEHLELKTARVLAESLEAIGQYARAGEVLRDYGVERRDVAQASLLQANEIRDKGYSEFEWQQAVNQMYRAAKISRISLDSTKPGLEGLSTEGVVERSVDGPLVSILIPTFNGASRIHVALDCLTKQTWKNLEIIVIDDGSSAEQFAALKEVTSKYPDVRLLQSEKNLGAYAARNKGLQASRGKFITVHDDDDWSHAQKIEIQATRLLENPNLVATFSKHVRISEELKFVRINRFPQYSQKNLSSLMFRREIFDEMGPWDSVNRGGDAEFYDRVRRVGKKKIAGVGAAPLSFTMTHSASLTSGEISRGYMDPARRFYHSAYLKRHRDAMQHPQNKLGRVPDPAVPEGMKLGMRKKDLGRFDLVVASDFSRLNLENSAILDVLENARQSGQRIGLFHIFSPNSMGEVRVADRVIEFAAREDVVVLSTSDKASIDELVVLGAASPAFMENFTTQLNVESVNLLVGFDSHDELWGEEATDTLERLFSTRPKVTTVGEYWGERMLDPAARPESITDSLSDRVAGTTYVENPSVCIWSEDEREAGQVSETLQKLGITETKASSESKNRGIFVSSFDSRNADRTLSNIRFALNQDAVVFAPIEMQPLLGDLALYPSAKDIPAALEKLLRTPELIDYQTNIARTVAQRDFLRSEG